MISEEHLERLAIRWFQDTGWSCANGADPAKNATTKAGWRSWTSIARKSTR
jgi:hypothetical protein